MKVCPGFGALVALKVTRRGTRQTNVDVNVKSNVKVGVDMQRTHRHDTATTPGAVAQADAAGAIDLAKRSDRYKWIALSNTTLGMTMATINSSITLIALPDIFRG